MAGDMLAYVFTNANFKPRETQIPANLISFDQAKYVDTWQAGMSIWGWVYLRQYCRTNVCLVHLNFHGCIRIMIIRLWETRGLRILD